jgi:hypothetical protein
MLRISKVEKSHTRSEVTKVSLLGLLIFGFLCFVVPVLRRFFSGSTATALSRVPCLGCDGFAVEVDAAIGAGWIISVSGNAGA